MGNKKFQVWLPLLLSLVMVWGMVIGYQLRGKTNSNNPSFLSNPRKTSVQEVLELVKEKYVDAAKVDSINQIVIDDLLSHLDPHSVFIGQKYVSDVNEDLMGNFQGIGIEFQVYSDTVNVTYVIKDGPSDKAGLQVGDLIIKANDTTSLTGKQANGDEIRKNLRGEAGTNLILTILRNGKPLTVAITRASIPINTIDAAYIIAPQVGYIKINKFGDRTYEEFMQNLEKLQKQGMQKMILDLRGNGGGLLNEATAIADEFLDGDKLIVYTEGAQSPRYEYRCRKEGLFEKGKLTVLIDETSASASEVLSGALQDWDRATIIGRRSFGKGLVQQQFQLSDGSAVRLTIARYYTPLGRNIQKPYANISKKDYEGELIDRYHNGTLTKEDTAINVGKAFKTQGGHVVYGGGGITPDLFVPMDTAKSTFAYTRLFFKNTLNDFIYHYFISNKKLFQGINTTAALQQKFKVGENEWQSLKAMAIKKEDLDLGYVSPTEKTKIEHKMDALMARQIARTEGYFEVLNQSDNTVLKALELLK